MLYHPPFGDGSYPAVGSACQNYTKWPNRCKQQKDWEMIKYSWHLPEKTIIIRVEKGSSLQQSGFQVNNLMKNSHYAWWAGWLFFCTCNHNDKYSKRNHQRKCLICTHVIPPLSEMEEEYKRNNCSKYELIVDFSY